VEEITRTERSITGACPGNHLPASGEPQVWHETDWQRWVVERYVAQGLTEQESRLATSGLNARLDHEPYWVGVLCDLDGRPHRHCVVPDRQGGFSVGDIPVWRRSEEVAASLLQRWRDQISRRAT
jgi:hypothetical protein